MSNFKLSSLIDHNAEKRTKLIGFQDGKGERLVFLLRYIPPATLQETVSKGDVKTLRKNATANRFTDMEDQAKVLEAFYGLVTAQQVLAVYRNERLEKVRVRDLLGYLPFGTRQPDGTYLLKPGVKLDDTFEGDTTQGTEQERAEAREFIDELIRFCKPIESFVFETATDVTNFQDGDLKEQLGNSEGGPSTNSA